MRKNLAIFYYYFFVIIAKNRIACNAVNFNSTMVRNRTISECINGYATTMTIRDPEMYITTSQFVQNKGYPAEEHLVETDDGYILTLHRIPGRPGAPPVLLQHGLLCSSFDWVVVGKEKALAFKLANAGYDVWMGNFRGSTYSRCHTKYDTSSFEFWDFSWHEIGIHDLPAMITYVTNTTSQRLTYIGHSMGTTTFFVMSIERPDISSKVKAMFALAPIAFTCHSTTPLRSVALFARLMELFREARAGTAQILSQTLALKETIKLACTSTNLQRRICARMFFLASGFNDRQFNYTLLPQLLYHTPAGASLKVIIHYFQNHNSGKFQYFDYGTEKNLKLYNSIKPLEYNVSKIAVPIGLFWSDSDVFTNPIDVTRLYEQLPNTILYYRVEYPDVNHLDYLYGIDAPKYVYEKLLSVMENYK